jgi:hypothetical protein
VSARREQKVSGVTMTVVVAARASQECAEAAFAPAVDVNVLETDVDDDDDHLGSASDEATNADASLLIVTPHAPELDWADGADFRFTSRHAGPMGLPRGPPV